MKPILSALLLLCFACTAHTYFLPPSKLMILIIGSDDRLEYISNHNSTLGRYYRTYAFTESGLPECVLCDRNDTSQPRERHGEERNVGTTYYDKPRGWWCAQTRPSAALAKLLPTLDPLPEFLLLIDDDTFVNPFKLYHLVTHLNPKKVMYRGFVRPFTYWGGAGILINRAVLEALLMPEPTDNNTISTTLNGTTSIARDPVPVRNRIEMCDMQKNGGKWCFWHSDWVVFECIRRVTGASGNHHRSFVFHPCDGKKDSPAERVTCHHIEPQQLLEYYDTARLSVLGTQMRKAYHRRIHKNGMLKLNRLPQVVLKPNEDDE